ncbi:MAG: RecX family transcriptional regulator [Clostridia bacterium]|nr:RecX family transcriptional regulator [Clostridia bacterium]
MMTTEQMTLCSIRALQGGARVALCLRAEATEPREETLTVLTARLARLPQCGPLTEEEYRALCAEAAVTDAIDMGLRLLAAGGGSRRQLLQKMRGRGAKSEDATAAIGFLAARGYLDEEREAVRAAERDLAKLWGDKRILADLRAKGYDDAAILRVMERLQAEDPAKRCAKLIKKRRMVLPREDEGVARFVASLMRYGYSVAEIKRALAENREL